MLTCLRKNIKIMLASQDWLIKPRLADIEDGIQVLIFDIYKTVRAIPGSVVSIEATPEIKQIIENLDRLFLHFNSQPLLFGSIEAGIYPREEKALLYNKGVFIKEIPALFSYCISVENLNRDRDLISDGILNSKIQAIWEDVNNLELMKAYLKESKRLGASEQNSKLKEFEFSIYPQAHNRPLWVAAFKELFGENSCLYTSDLAAKEVTNLGYNPVKLGYYGEFLMSYCGIKKDVDLCRDDYEFTWAASLSKEELERLDLLKQICTTIGFEMPMIRVFDSYAKGESVLGVFNSQKDEIYLKREILRNDLCSNLDTFIHELTHRTTGAGDYDREFALGLSRLAARVSLLYLQESGFPVKLKVTKRGIQMPLEFAYSPQDLDSYIAVVGNEIVIKTCGKTLRATLATQLPVYCAQRKITFYKGHFYINIPARIRDLLPDELEFRLIGQIQ